MFFNLKRIMAAAGASMDRVVKMTVYVRFRRPSGRQQVMARRLPRCRVAAGEAYIPE